MNCLLRLPVMVTLLLMCLNRWSHATNYRAFRVDANVQVNLTCWELTDASHLVIWMTPKEDIIGPDYQDKSNKYSINFDGSLVVNGAVKSDTGTYKCISKAPDAPYVMMKTELEVIDVSYLPEVDDWEKNLTRGLIAAASTAAFFIAACGFAHFNFEERHPKRKESSSISRRRSHQSSTTSSDPSSLLEMKGVDNPAMSVDSSEIDSGL